MAAGRSGMNASLELADMEMSARLRARKTVANLLQRPDQLEKVELIRKGVARRKGSVEAMLKSAVQSQLDGVKTGLQQLHVALKDIRDIRHNLDEIEKTYQSVAGLGSTLKPIREENLKHSQYAAAVDNLVHIYTVPETIKRCEDLINDNKLLAAHKSLSELELCRDDLLYELYRQQNQSPTDRNTVVQYFSGLEKPLRMLEKQLWLILQRTIISVRMEPTIVVTALRIIEREERMDAAMSKRYEDMQMSGRPKQWKKKALEVLKDAVLARIEGNQMEDRSTNKMWLVRHLEVTRQLVLEDLRVVKTVCEPCFPPSYDVVNEYIRMYHAGISQHLNDVVQAGLEGNEIVSLLTWVNEYSSRDLMGHPDLNIDVSQFSPLLDQSAILQLQEQYVANLRNNFKEWMANSLKTDTKDWIKDSLPDADEKGYFNTHLPVIVIQMIEQNLDVAVSVGAPGLVLRLADLCSEEFANFISIYRKELQFYKDQHTANRGMPQYYIHYMVANANNCQTFADFAVRLQKRHESEVRKDQMERTLGIGQNSAENVVKTRYPAIFNGFQNLARTICSWSLDEVFLDLDKHIQELMTKQWLAEGNDSLIVSTICITVEDYCQDFVRLRQVFYDEIVDMAQQRVAKEYYKAVFSRKMMFKSYDERCPAADKISRESNMLSQLFSKIQHKKTQAASPFDALVPLSEFLRMKDTSMMSLEVTGFVNNYPDVKIEQLVNVLMMRGDMSRGDARQLVVDCLGEDYDSKPKNKKTIFSLL